MLATNSTARACGVQAAAFGRYLVGTMSSCVTQLWLHKRALQLHALV